jgi:hypothetical protein
MQPESTPMAASGNQPSTGTALALSPCVHSRPGSTDMSLIAITDLKYDRELDYAAMARISGGGGAPWVFGWITPYVEQRQQGYGGMINLYEITNNINIGQFTNQVQTVDVNNTGSGATLTVNPNALTGNRAG